jgi:L-2-hydroxyglutarate oxidase LhgO
VRTKIAGDDGKSDGKSEGRSAGIEILLLGLTPQNGSFYILEPSQHVNPSNRIVYPDILLIFKSVMFLTRVDIIVFVDCR